MIITPEEYADIAAPEHSFTGPLSFNNSRERAAGRPQLMRSMHPALRRATKFGALLTRGDSEPIAVMVDKPKRLDDPRLFLTIGARPRGIGFARLVPVAWCELGAQVTVRFKVIEAAGNAPPAPIASTMSPWPCRWWSLRR